jgi:hypothetical protein
VERKIEAVGQELQQIDADLAGERGELKRAETEIAVSGAQIPDEPLPVEKRISRIERHQRIVRTRKAIFEQELGAATAAVRAADEAVKEEWRTLGLEQTKEIRTRYREAAAALKSAYVDYCIWLWQFPGTEARRDFPPPRACPVVCDLGGRDILIQPRGFAPRQALEAQAPDLVAGIRALRAEIDGCK